MSCVQKSSFSFNQIFCVNSCLNSTRSMHTHTSIFCVFLLCHTKKTKHTLLLTRHQTTHTLFLKKLNQVKRVQSYTIITWERKLELLNLLKLLTHHNLLSLTPCPPTIVMPPYQLWFIMSTPKACGNLYLNHMLVFTSITTQNTKPSSLPLLWNWQ